jgi:hypothetical protein
MVSSQTPLFSRLAFPTYLLPAASDPRCMGAFGLRMATAWLACRGQARSGQARQVREWLVWFSYACMQARFGCCLVAFTSSTKVISCVCTLAHAHGHALALAPLEPGSRETADFHVPTEPGRVGIFACAEPGRGGGAGNQTRGACICWAWFEPDQATKRALIDRVRYCYC